MQVGGSRKLSRDWLAFDQNPTLWLDYRLLKSEEDVVSPDFVHLHDSGRRLWVSHIPPGLWLLDRLRTIDGLAAEQKVSS